MRTGVVIAAMAVGAILGCLAVGATPNASAQQAGAVPLERGGMTLATGGSAQNLNDIAWVLTTDTYEDPKTKKTIDRKVLLCYRVGNNGKLVDIVDVRDITWDVKVKQLNLAGHNAELTPDKMREEWEKAKKRAEDETGRPPR